MPWSPSDAEGFTSAADTQAKRERWAAVANDALSRCLDDGGETEECEASAIQQANAVISRMREEEGSAVELAQVATVNLGAAGKHTLEELVEAVTLKNTAKGLLRQLTAVLDRRDVPETLRKELQDVIDAMARTWADLSGEAETERGERMPTTAQEADEIGEDMETSEESAAEMYDEPMVVGDALSFGDLDADAEAQAYAQRAEQLTDQFRALVGNALWAPAERVPDKAQKMRELVDEFIDRLSLEPEMTQESAVAAMAGLAELAEAELREERGQVVELIEQTEDNGDGAGPLRMRVALIEPGMGNSRDNHLYEREMLKRDAHVFEGVKMYATDHRKTETNVRTEVSQVLRCPVGFTGSGAPIAEVGVFDPTFARAIRNREALGILDGLHCSIRAKGKIKRGVEFDGQTVNKVEAIVAAESVDWVSQAGAGGRALALVESIEGTEGFAMSDKTENDKITEDAEEPEEEAQVVEATLAEATQADDDAQEAEVTELSMAQTLAALLRADLPDATRARIAERAPFADEAALEATIEAEQAYLAEVAPQPQRGPRVTGMSRARRETVEESATDQAEEADESDIVRAYLGR